MVDTQVLLARADGMGDLTHEDIARRAGIERSVVTRLLQGGVPKLATVTALAWAYGIDLNELIPRPATPADEGAA